MSNDRIKSAWEIALEKAEKLGKLSPEEAREKQEEELLPRGRALGERYLAGLPRRDLELGLDKYNDKETNVVLKGMYETLVAAISLEEVEKSGRVLEGILFINKESTLLQIKDNTEALLKRYREDRKKLFESLQETIARKAEEQLRQKGIAGSAIEVNVKASKDWQEAQQQLYSKYHGELGQLKKALLELF